MFPNSMEEVSGKQPDWSGLGHRTSRHADEKTFVSPLFGVAGNFQTQEAAEH